MKKYFLSLLLLSCFNAMAAGDLSSIGKTFISKKPLMYLTNLPWHQTATPNIKRDAPTYLKHNRVLSELRNACSNCLDKSRLITPIRVAYIAPGTAFLVKGVFTLTEGFGRAIDYYVLEDAKGVLSESMTAGFIKMFESSDKSLDEEEQNSSLAADLYNKGQNVTLTTCESEIRKKLEWLREDFSLEQDISIKDGPKFGGSNCTEFEFENLSAYLTYRHFKGEWSYGARGLESDREKEKCIETLNEENKGSIICRDALRRLPIPADEESVKKLIMGWKVDKSFLRNLEGSPNFSNWSPELQLLIIENRLESEVLLSTCRPHKEKSARLQCYLENTECWEFSGLRNYSECQALRKEKIQN